ncbi:MAG: lysophospholipid acyltransferase family protein [Cyclobacteriaceae bacterium]|jgi:Kdo2-lipid IVA lauroyltransferase/acyltransferase|nr:lysophospholipid acyltransferase family protein [Cyclobacteriaceae bacterium]
MKLLNLIFFYGALIPISRLPFRVLYVISDCLYFILYKALGYRKSVVIRNITNSFPHKSNEEHIQLMSDFYRHLCDLTVENIKVFTISEKELSLHFKFINPEFIDRYYDQGRSVIMALGHLNNWELTAVSIAKSIKHQPIALYRPFTNKFFDAKMRESRSRYGLKMIPTRQTWEEFNKGEGLRAIVFAFDQSPVNPKKCYWGTFLNQDTAMNFGVEKYSKAYNYPVIYGRINKVKRGHYTYEFTEVIEAPQSEYGYITQRVNDLLEQDILKTPQYWLWSHKRWKYKRPVDQVLTHQGTARE